MGRVIAVANQKGGVGKTTTVINLSACLAEKGKKVLVIDIDPQGNTSSGLGVDKNNAENTVYELLLGESELSDCIIENVYDGLSVVPANVNLAGAEIELIGIPDQHYILKKHIEAVRADYDFIILDCPPSLNTLTVNAMSAADSVLVPIQCENVKDTLKQNIYKTIIPRNVRLAESPSHGVPINIYDSKSAGAEGYRALADEVIESDVTGY